MKHKKDQIKTALTYIKDLVKRYHGGNSLEEIYQDYLDRTPLYSAIGKQDFSTLLHLRGFYKELTAYYDDGGKRTTKNIYFYDADLKVEL